MQADLSAPSCPYCRHAMYFAETVQQVGGLVELQRFQCSQCGLLVSGKAAAEVLHMMARGVLA